MQYSVFLKSESLESREKIAAVFRSFPDKTPIRYLTLSAGEVLIRQGDTVSGIYVLIDGRLLAINNNSDSSSYIFSEFTPITLFGEQEVLSDTKRVLAELRASTPCRFFFIRKDDYLEWVSSDVKTLLSRSKSTIKMLLDQSSREMSSLFHSSLDRIGIFLVDYYEKHLDYTQKDAPVVVRLTQSEIAETIGFSLRTVCRALKDLTEQKLITQKKGKTNIFPKQYETLKELYYTADDNRALN